MKFSSRLVTQNVIEFFAKCRPTPNVKYLHTSCSGRNSPTTSLFREWELKGVAKRWFRMLIQDEPIKPDDVFFIKLVTDRQVINNVNTGIKSGHLHTLTFNKANTVGTISDLPSGSIFVHYDMLHHLALVSIAIETGGAVWASYLPMTIDDTSFDPIKV